LDMSDRGFCFLFSCVVILASLGAAGWLVVTGQAAYVDGLFLLLTCLLIAAAFGLYVMFMIHRAMEPAETQLPSRPRLLPRLSPNRRLWCRRKKPS